MGSDDTEWSLFSNLTNTEEWTVTYEFTPSEQFEEIIEYWRQEVIQNMTTDTVDYERIAAFMGWQLWKWEGRDEEENPICWIDENETSPLGTPKEHWLDSLDTIRLIEEEIGEKGWEERYFESIQHVIYDSERFLKNTRKEDYYDLITVSADKRLRAIDNVLRHHWEEE